MEASESRELECWVASYIHALNYFGGVPEIIVPNNLKCGITSHCRYEPDINPTYFELAQHYEVIVNTAGLVKSKDKPKPKWVC